MKTYPSIPRVVQTGSDWLVYDKLDGQNIRVEWAKKKGFWKFGSRKVLADLPQQAIDLINDQLEAVEKVFAKLYEQKAVLFFEYYGDNSFAGMHEEGDEMKIALLDVYLMERKEWMDPRDVEKKFRGRVPLPRLIMRGFNKADEAAVRDGCLRGVTFEGVVCKSPAAGRKHAEPPKMFKVKSAQWIEQVKSRYGDKAKELL